MYATEKNIRNHLTTDDDGATIIACTVKRISEEEEAALIEQHPDSPTWHHKSWALVTFLHKRTQLAKLESFPNFPEGADPTDATGRQNAIVLGMDAVDEAGRQVTVARKKMQSTSGLRRTPGESCVGARAMAGHPRLARDNRPEGRAGRAGPGYGQRVRCRAHR